MHRKNKKHKYHLVYSLGEHPYLGFLIEPHAIMLNPNGELSFTHKRLFSSTAGDYDGIELDARDRQLIRLLDEIEQAAVIKRHYRKSIRPNDYFTTIFNKELYDVIRPQIEQRLLKVMDLLPGKSLYLMGKDGYPADQQLSIASEPASVLFHFRRNEVETRYFPTIKYEGQRIEFMYRDAQIVINEQAWMLLDQVLYYFEEPLEGKKLTPFLHKRYISVSRATERKYFEVFVRGLIERHHVYAEGFDIKTYQHQATPVLKIMISKPKQTLDLEQSKQASHLKQAVQTGQVEAVRMELAFQYGPYLFAPASDNRVSVQMEYDEGADLYTFHRIRRSIAWEQKKKQELLDLDLVGDAGLFGHGGELKPDATKDYVSVWDWLQQNRQKLEEKGFEVRQRSGDIRYFLGQASLSIEVSENNDWFDLHAIARFGEHEIPFLKLKSHILSDKREFVLPNGEIAVIPEEWFARYPQLFYFAETGTGTGSGFKLKKHHLGLLETLDSIDGTAMERKLARLHTFEQMTEVPLPRGFQGSLRPYQQAAFNWFYFLQEYRFGGCLADDMGLGKTIQALALLQKEKEITGEQGKRVVSLVIMPTSLIYNWQREAQRFVPDLQVLVHTGINRGRDPGVFAAYDLIITTYGIARIDQELLQSFHFHYIILDESQHIKNPSSKAFKMVRDLKSAHRLVLSGTPVENSVTDLWSQMTFLNPGLLGSYRYFNNEFVGPIEKKKDAEKAARLQAMVKPFILRRTKEQVADELPPKSEQVVYCEMEADQKGYYERIKSEYRNMILEASEQGQTETAHHGTDASALPARRNTQIALLQGLTKLRQIANHPRMIDETYHGTSGKFDQVLEQLDTALQRGNKVLLFSQFVKQLSVFREYFDRKAIPYAYLDGATIQRQQEIDRFRKDEDVRLFLISIKAGGVGLNLTEADYVFVLDPWWNPAVEQQAIDRAHRIGQQKTVFIYKFITKDSVEEKILALQDRKTKLADSLITTEDSFYKSLSQEDIKMLLE